MYDNYIYCYISECLGTFILCLGVACGTYYDKPNIQRTDFITTLSVIFTSMLMHAKIGGADFNPGVTLTKYIAYTGELKSHLQQIISMYFVVQCVGAFVSFLCYGVFTGGVILYKLDKTSDTSIISGFIMEFIASYFTYLFIIVIDRNQNLNKNFTFKLFSCATAVATGMSIGSNTSGAGLNPAVGIGSSFARAILLGSVSEIKQLWMFVVAPLLAAYCAGNTFTQVKDMYYNFKDVNEETEKMGLQEVVQT